MSRLWPPQVVHQPPVVTTLRTVMVPRIPRVVETGRIVTLIIAPARYLAEAVKRLTVRVRQLTVRVRKTRMLSPLLLDKPPPADGATT